MNQDKEMNNTSPAEYYEVMNPEKVTEKEKKDPIQEIMQEMAEDPDEFLKKFGADRFRLLLEESSNRVEYQLAAIC